jgi:hypothetical protein
VGLLGKFVADRRGVAALELSLTFLFMITLLLPIVDLGIAATQYINAFQALRGLGVYAQYHAPPDVTLDLTSWKSSLPSVGYAVSTIVKCGDAAAPCSATNPGSPKWFSFSTGITISPLFLTAPAFGLAGTYTIQYAERFQ